MMHLPHMLRALGAVIGREVVKFAHQRGRLLSALVRPLLWLIAFGAGFQNVFGISIMPPYRTYVLYQDYIIPGLLGIVLLFHGMQSSLAMVYDREMGIMRLLLTAPLPRWYLLLCKLLAGTTLSIVTAYVFLAVSYLFDVSVPLSGWLYAFPAMIVSGLMLGALGLLLSVYMQQLENFAATMNFVIFPMFFISSALYPLWKLRESGAMVVYWLAAINPFTHVVELIRFALYGIFNGLSAAIVVACGVAFFVLAVFGYDPQLGAIRRAPRGA